MVSILESRAKKPALKHDPKTVKRPPTNTESTTCNAAPHGNANRENLTHSLHHLHQVPKPRYPHNSGILSEALFSRGPQRQPFVAGVEGQRAPRDLLFQIFGKLKIEPTL
jgi:hypothetical protein